MFLNFWKLEKISGDIYNIIYTGWDRNTAIKKALTVFVDDQSVATVGINVFANTEYQKWKIQ